MEIKLYTTSSDNNVVNKSLGPGRTLQGTLRETTDVFEPQVMIEGDYPPENYSFIPEFGKYYTFSKPPQSYRNGCWILFLREDVLMTLKSQFLPLEAIIDRQEYNYNPYIRDSLAPVESDTFFVTKKLQGGKEFTYHSNVLLVMCDAMTS